MLGGRESSGSPKAAFLRPPAADRSQSQNQGQLHCPSRGQEARRKLVGAVRTPGQAEPLLTFHSPSGPVAQGSQTPKEPLEVGNIGEGRGALEKSISFLCDFHSLALPCPPLPSGPPPPPSEAEVSAFDEKLLQLYSGGGKRRVTPRGSPGLIEK